MKQMQSYRLDAKTIKEIDIIAQKTMRTKSNVIEVAIKEYYQNMEDKMKHEYNLESVMEIVGAENEQQFHEEFYGRSVDEIKLILKECFGKFEGDDTKLAEAIKHFAIMPE